MMMTCRRRRRLVMVAMNASLLMMIMKRDDDIDDDCDDSRMRLDTMSDGEVFVDGSISVLTQRGGLRRAGWSVICINGDGSFRCGMYGAVPLAWSLSQSFRDAGDYAFHMLARFSVEPSVDGSLAVFSWTALARSRARASPPRPSV